MNDIPYCRWFHQASRVPHREECMAPSEPCPTSCHGFPSRCTQTRAREAQVLARVRADRPVGLHLRLARMGYE